MYRFRSNQRTATERRPGRTYSLWLRWLLLLLLWPGPVPWYHSHESWASASQGTAASLREHLNQFHSVRESARPVRGRPARMSLVRDPASTTIPDRTVGSVAGEATLDWHLHWLMPSCDSKSPLPDPGGPARRAVELVETPSPWSLALPLGVGAGLSGGADRGDSSSLLRLDAPGHFLDAFAPSLPLPLRLGILRI